MKLSELMATHTPSPTFEGFVTNDDFVLAIDCSADGSTEVKDYAVAQINAEKAVIEAEAKAETLRIAAEAEADANRKIAASLTNELIEKIKYEQWNGELPTVTGSTPIISLEP